VGSQGANKALAKVTSLQLQTHLVTPVLAEATFFFTSHIPASLFDSVVSALPADRFAASSAGLPTHAGYRLPAIRNALLSLIHSRVAVHTIAAGRRQVQA
jgi:hypothetical protein